MERERTGSARLEVVSLEPRIAEMEEAKAAGLLRLDLCLERVVWLGFKGCDVDEFVQESESVSEAEGEVGASDADVVRWDAEDAVAFTAVDVSEPSSEPESARVTAGNSSSSADGDEDGLE